MSASISVRTYVGRLQRGENSCFGQRAFEMVCFRDLNPKCPLPQTRCNKNWRSIAHLLHLRKSAVLESSPTSFKKDVASCSSLQFGEQARAVSRFATIDIDFSCYNIRRPVGRHGK